MLFSNKVDIRVLDQTATNSFHILDFKLSPCSSNDELSSGYFPGVWVLKTDVSEHCISSIFNRCCSHCSTCWSWNRYSVPKRRFLLLRRRGNTQKTIHPSILFSISSPSILFSISSFSILFFISSHFYSTPYYFVIPNLQSKKINIYMVTYSWRGLSFVSESLGEKLAASHYRRMKQNITHYYTGTQVGYTENSNETSNPTRVSNFWSSWSSIGSQEKNSYITLCPLMMQI